MQTLTLFSSILDGIVHQVLSEILPDRVIEDNGAGVREEIYRDMDLLFQAERPEFEVLDLEERTFLAGQKVAIVKRNQANHVTIKFLPAA